VKFQERFNIPEVEEFFNSSEGVLSLLNTSKNSWFVGAVGHHGGLKRLLYGNMYVPVLTDDDGNIVRSSKTGFATQLPHHVGGEILVRVPNEKVFGGYHGNEAATKKKFERDVFKKGDLFYRSGDALYRDVDGRWHFKDRLGDTFRWKGENVSTAEVQAVLGKFEVSRSLQRELLERALVYLEKSCISFTLTFRAHRESQKRLFMV
jgi:acyl-CoA synthetase (AMP-forming)/AMP-acid ligase II